MAYKREMDFDAGEESFAMPGQEPLQPGEPQQSRPVLPLRDDFVWRDDVVYSAGPVRNEKDRSEVDYPRGLFPTFDQGDGQHVISGYEAKSKGDSLTQNDQPSIDNPDSIPQNREGESNEEKVSETEGELASRIFQQIQEDPDLLAVKIHFASLKPASEAMSEGDSFICQPQSNPRGNEAERTGNRELITDAVAFQRDYEVLREPDMRSVAPFAFHINERRVLTKISDGQMVPFYLRQGRPFNAKRDREVDDYRVHFASGNVDLLAKFLAGNALFTKTDNWDITDYSQINSTEFIQSMAVAVADTRSTPMKLVKAGHDIHTLYSPVDSGEKVDLLYSHQAVPVEVLQLPLTVLLPEQIEELRREGFDRYKSGQFDSESLFFPIEDENHAANIYAHSKHQELTVKYTLRKFLSMFGGDNI